MTGGFQFVEDLFFFNALGEVKDFFVEISLSIHITVLTRFVGYRFLCSWDLTLCSLQLRL